MIARLKGSVVILMMIIIVASCGAGAGELRVSTMGNCRIAMEDVSTGINPYDFGGNPAYLLDKFEYPWIRFKVGWEEEQGDLKRQYDPHLTNNLYGGFSGMKALGDRHVARGEVRYYRYVEREIYHSVEREQYNDPFYLTDVTTGDFEYYGPSMEVDYSLRLNPDLIVGASLDYDISTGLKQEYTRPDIVHNYVKATLGMTYRMGDRWIMGITASPRRRSNRTNFARTDEGYDNIVHFYSGDGIYEVRSFQGWTYREVMWGGDFRWQGFYMGDRFRMGTILEYGIEQNTLRSGSRQRLKKGYWQDQTYDFRMMGRYKPGNIPLVLGFRGELLKKDGWARRPEYENVLLYDNPVNLQSVGAGISYAITPLNLLLSAEYEMNRYDIEARDYGAQWFRAADIIQNIGRLGIEYNVMDIYSVRGGVEVTDYPIDRWLKTPGNMDRYRFTGGLGYQYGLWKIDLELMYRKDTKEDFYASRRGLSGIVWFTRLVH